ncbi:MAG: hypothetical protein E6K80_01450 [Candidatus Eisenbacteria bacterium]|uniref:Uncharacterized protein n=1 Tax=Eiseniibacteriota bacterium TaxID=2212470 RepID=A0A538UAI5_UNCEI|nr:MAG: hypothetical protein E6K80_01450 [Candidatus Eisenbacteria bacterium]
MRHPVPSITAVLLACVAAHALAQTEVKKPAAAEPAKAGPAAVLGHADSVKWSATTYEAASAEANKKVLESGKPAHITGEVVDVSCYLQLGKRGPAHVACGSKCLQNGQPIGLLDDDGKLYIVMAEEHHPRRDGQVDLRSVFIPLLSKMVTVNGMEVETKGYHALFVNAADLGAVKTGATEKK